MAVQLVKLLDPAVQLNIQGGFTYLGEYAGGTPYAIGDMVDYNGSSYVAKGDTTGNLPTDTTYWQLVAEKGDTGNAGADGAPGVDGSPGSPGTPGADGVGVPDGGTTGQALVKNSNTDLDTKWSTVTVDVSGKLDKSGGNMTGDIVCNDDADILVTYVIGNPANNSYDVNIDGASTAGNYAGNAIIAGGQAGGASGRGGNVQLNPGHGSLTHGRIKMTNAAGTGTLIVDSDGVVGDRTVTFPNKDITVAGTVDIPDVSGKADKTNVLELDNTDAFTPDADYEPATKKYVDDNIGGGPIAFTDLTDVPANYTDAANKLVAVNGTADGLAFITASGGGDMMAATYDPTNVNADAFDTDNHVDGTTNHVFTALDDTKLAGIEAGADVTDATNVAAAGAVMSETDPVFTAWDKDYADLSNKPDLSDLHAPHSDDQDLSGYSPTTHNHTGVYAPVLGADDNYVTDTEKSNLHAPNSDNQDLSGYLEQSGTNIITVGTSTPGSPSAGDLWVDTN